MSSPVDKNDRNGQAIPALARRIDETPDRASRFTLERPQPGAAVQLHFSDSRAEGPIEGRVGAIGSLSASTDAPRRRFLAPFAGFAAACCTALSEASGFASGAAERSKLASDWLNRHRDPPGNQGREPVFLLRI